LLSAGEEVVGRGDALVCEVLGGVGLVGHEDGVQLLTAPLVGGLTRDEYYFVQGVREGGLGALLVRYDLLGGVRALALGDLLEETLDVLGEVLLGG